MAAGQLRLRGWLLNYNIAVDGGRPGEDSYEFAPAETLGHGAGVTDALQRCVIPIGSN